MNENAERLGETGRGFFSPFSPSLCGGVEMGGMT